jgi:hypothetical protein
LSDHRTSMYNLIKTLAQQRKRMPGEREQRAARIHNR